MRHSAGVMPRTSTKKRGGGPSSPDGKANSSKNALKHGGRAALTLLAPGETQEEFDALAAIWRGHFRPDNDSSRLLVERLIRNEWMLARAERNLLNAEASAAGCGDDPLEWPEETVHRLHLMQRYKTAAERAALRSYQLMRQLENDNIQARLQHRKMLKEVAKERMELVRARQGEQASEQRLPEAPWQESAAQENAPSPVVQRIEVHIEYGRTVTAQVSPSNAELIAQVAAMNPRPELKRRFVFRDGVPAEYGWLLKGRSREYPAGSVISVDLSYEELLLSDERERANGDGHLWGELE